MRTVEDDRNHDGTEEASRRRNLAGVRELYGDMGTNKSESSFHRRTTWQLNQSNETKSQNLQHEWDTLLTLETEFGGSKEEKSQVLDRKEVEEGRSFQA